PRRRSTGMSDRILVEVSDHIAHVRLNRPEKRNALDADMFEGLVAAARRLAEDRSVRAVVLSGEGDSFCAGIDMANFSAMAGGTLSAESDEVKAAVEDRSPDGANRAQQLAWLWQELPVPVIAAVQGAAYGGGLHIALGADIRFIAPDARIAFVEITWGLVPDMSGTQAIRRLLPLDVAKKLIFSGEPISGERAVELHLGTETSAQPLEDAFALARTIAQRSPDAIRAAKKLLNASALVPLSEGLANEMDASGGLMGGKNQVEAIVSKLEKRQPEFVDPA
ncbi:MAG: crotonase/enoyl-CoA hydratase family protein, partial [Myxococcota bacterium]